MLASTDHTYYLLGMNKVIEVQLGRLDVAAAEVYEFGVQKLNRLHEVAEPVVDYSKVALEAVKSLITKN